MIIKVKQDIKKVESILEMVENREKSISFLDYKKFSTIIAETYYEIIKELSSALILFDGFKSVGEKSHKDLINFLLKYETLSMADVSLIDDLRIKRNKSSYEGKSIEALYLQRNQKKILQIIKKLKTLINNKLSK